MFRKLIDAFRRSTALMSLLQWIDSDANADVIPEKMPSGKSRVEWVRIMPFIFNQLCLYWGLSEIFGRFRAESGMRI